MKKEKSTVLKIDDELNISKIGKIRGNILNKMKDSEIIEIQFVRGEQIDLSGIQLIESIRKSYLENGKNIKITLKTSPEAIDLLLNTGFKNLINSITQ